MITIFILLGLGFLCGGVAAIVDGLPYMVLERGFTQVIIGTVAAATGVLMLALSWVLVELRRLRKTLSNAAMAMSVASMVGGPDSGSDGAMPRVVPAPGDAAGTPGPGLAVAGALVGAGAALTASRVLAAGVSGEPEDKAAEPDLFGAVLADVVKPGPDMEIKAPDPTLEADVDALPAFDPFRPVDPQSEPALESTMAAAPEAEAETSRVAAFAPEDEAMLDAAEAAETTPAARLPGELSEDFPAGPGPSDIENPLENVAAAASARAADDFGMLRESLAGLGLGSEPAVGRVEPSFAEVYRLGEPVEEPVEQQDGHRVDDLAAAASWMEPASQRRAPWFEDAAPAALEPIAPSSAAEPGGVPEILPEIATAAEAETPWPRPGEAGPGGPPWPLPLRDVAAFEPEFPLPELQGWDDAVREQAALKDASSPAAGIETPDMAAHEASAAGDDAAPAASDEGIVGAYQVGEAHFTIYADGSIQARTPDGDYSFTSMDELKIYLASEKSRLGV